MNYIEKKYLIAKMRKELEVKFDPDQIQKRLDDYRRINSRTKGPIEEFYETICTSLSEVNNIVDPRIANLINVLRTSSDDKTKVLCSFLQNLVMKLRVNPSEKMIEQIYSTLEADENGDIVTKVDHLTIVNSMSYCCLLNDLIRMGYENKAEVLFEKIISGTISPDEEIIEIISILRKHQNLKGQEMLPNVIDAYEVYLTGGNKNVVLDNLRKLLIMVDIHQMKFKKTSDGSHYDPDGPTVYLNDIINDEITVFHEFGHTMDEYFSSRSTDEDNEALFRAARNKANRSRVFAYELKRINGEMIRTKNNACEIYDQVMLERFGTMENIYLHFYQYVHDVIQKYGLKTLLETFGVSEETTEEILKEYRRRTLDEFELAKQVYELDKRNFAQKHWRTKKECSVLDIISAVFKTRNIFIDNDRNRLMIAHDSDYYYESPDKQMTEIMANLNALLVIGAEDQIRILRTMFGDQFVDFIISKYQSALSVKSVSSYPARRV